MYLGREPASPISAKTRTGQQNVSHDYSLLPRYEKKGRERSGSEAFEYRARSQLPLKPKSVST